MKTESRKRSKSLYNDANREKINKKQRVYDNANREKINTRQKSYNDANREKINARQASYDESNREKVNKKQKSYNEANKEKINTRQKAYNETNKENIRAKQTVRDNQHAEEVKSKKEKMLWTERILAFKQAIVEGPNYVCLSCNKTLFKKGVKILTDKQEESLKTKWGEDSYQALIAHHDTIHRTIFCHTCYLSLSKKKTPRLHVSNGLMLDPIPDELKLTELEQQLIALVQIFMKITLQSLIRVPVRLFISGNFSTRYALIRGRYANSFSKIRKRKLRYFQNF